MKNQENPSETVKVKIKQAGFFIVNLQFLLLNNLGTLPAIAATEEPKLTIVHSQENANHWTGIKNRLQSAGVKYCVISLGNVKNAADWGDRRVLFLPNVEILTPTQAIALEEWVSKGGRLITSGPVGSLSAPGVRQLLRSVLGGYWGFSLNETQQLQPAKTKVQEWTKQNGLFGKVHGGVLIAEDGYSQAAAIWNSQDSPAAVVTNERSTLLGWRWGVDSASAPELDTAWLKASLNHYLSGSSNASQKIEGASQNCSPSVEAIAQTGYEQQGNRESVRPGVSTPITAPAIFPSPIFSSSTPSKTTPSKTTPPLTTPSKTTASRNTPPRNTPPRNKPPVTKIATAPQPRTLNSGAPQRSQEAIDQLEQAVRLDVSPNSNAPIDRNEALALQQELQNLIGRVESSHLAASVSVTGGGEVTSKNPEGLKVEHSQLIASTTGRGVLSSEKAISQAREIVKNLPQLISQKNYALARQQWLTAKASLWKQFPLDRRLAQPEIRSVWLDRGTIVRAGSEAGLAEIFDRLAQAGINTVFFETVNASYTIYPSQVAPEQNPLIQGWDPLAAAVKLAHARGMELHAWVWAFAAGNQRHNELINVNADYPGPVLAAHPDWANYDNRGNMIPVGQTKPFFDQANPELRQYLLKLYEEIVTRYQVDGLQLDYIRYPFQDPAAGRTYGYGKAAREKFQQQTGVDPVTISPKDRELWQKWTEFRTEQVNSFVAEVSQMLRQKRSNLILSVAVFPLPELERIQKIQQNWEIWARQGDIDLIVPMTYALDTSRFQRLAQPWIISTKLGSSLLVPGIRLLSLPTVGAFDQLQLVRDLPVSGYALFAAENLTNELQKVFTNTQGKAPQTSSEPIPHRQPFQTAAVRYTALQKEWKFILQNEQMQMPDAVVSDFNTQAEVLQNTLNQLASSPSASQLLGARAALTRFQAQFRTWMREEAIENPYQVKVWENRLATIERLLRYGERRVLLRP